MIDRLHSDGYSVKDCCEALNISRSNYYRVKTASEIKIIDITENLLIEKIKAIKLEHPFWGYRRVRAWLVHREGIKINEKKVKRIMKEQELLVNRKFYKAKRTANKSKPKATEPNQYFGIDDKIYGIFCRLGLSGNSLGLVYKENSRLGYIVKE